MNEGLCAVFDSGPLIHLSEIGALSLLEIFTTKTTTDVVADEVKRYITSVDHDYMVQQVRIYAHNEISESGTLRALAKIYSLDSGEISALALCGTLKPKTEIIFFSDDSAARMVSDSLGITSVGTIGIIIKSATLGKTEKARALDLLESIPGMSTLFIKKELLKSIMDRLKKEWDLM